MPLITCVDCNKEMSDLAPACPNCGRPKTIKQTATPNNPQTVASNKPQVVDQRPMTLLLAVGVVFFPYIFAWFTLRKGYSDVARGWSLGYLVFLVSLAIFSPNDRKSNTPTASATTIGEPQPNLGNAIDVDDIIKAYEANEISADNKYKGRVIEMRGIVHEVKKDIWDDPYVTLGTGARFETTRVRLYFDAADNNNYATNIKYQLAALSKGARLTVVCKIIGLQFDLRARNCDIQ